MADTRRLLDALLETGFAGRARGPGAPLEGPAGAGPAAPAFERLMEWVGESLTGGGAARRTARAASLEEGQALLLVRAMIAAARADGRIDAAERARIRDRLSEAGLGAAEQALLERELEETAPPPAPAETTDRHLAGLVYAASLRAVDPGRPAGRAYLERLARSLRLSPDETAAIRQRLGQAP